MFVLCFNNTVNHFRQTLYGEILVFSSQDAALDYIDKRQICNCYVKQISPNKWARINKKRSYKLIHYVA